MNSFGVTRSLRHLASIDVEENIPGRPEGVRRQVLSSDPSSGYVTWLFDFPPQYKALSAVGREAMLEYHSSSEEILTLEGSLRFGRFYELPRMTYAFHPAGWVHPAAQQSADGCRVLMRRSSPDIDFQFLSPPEDWAGEEFNALEGEGKSPRGITRLNIENLPWLQLITPRGSATGISVKVLLEDDGRGWCTYMMHVPPDWRGCGERFSVGSGDELFVLAGDLRISEFELSAGSFFQDSREFRYDGNSVASREGCLAIRWTCVNPSLQMYAS